MNKVNILIASFVIFIIISAMVIAYMPSEYFNQLRKDLNEIINRLECVEGREITDIWGNVSFICERYI